jgi:hypothetical protein
MIFLKKIVKETIMREPINKNADYKELDQSLS